MSNKENSKKNSEYTLENILAEYDEKSIKRNKSEDSNKLSKDAIKADDEADNYDDLPDDDFDNIELIKQESILSGVSKTDLYDVSELSADSKTEQEIVAEIFGNSESEYFNYETQGAEGEPEILDNVIEIPEFSVITAEELEESLVVDTKEIEEELVSEEISKEEPVTDEEIFDDSTLDTDENDTSNQSDAAEDNSNTVPLIENNQPDIKQADLIWCKKIAVSLFPVKGDSFADIVRKVIFLVAVSVFVIAGIMLASTLIQSRRALHDLEDLKTMITTTVATSINEQGEIVTVPPTDEEILEQNYNVLKELANINEDIKAFIELEGCDIFYPVTQTEDNSYYLTRTYYKADNKAGAIFLDYRCKLTDDYSSPNLVFYGHNQEDGTMFGNLKLYKHDTEFYQKNPVVTLRTFNGIEQYVIYGYFVTNTLAKQDSNGEVFHYHDYIEVLNDENTFNWYMNEIQRRNQIISPVDVEFGDSLMTLSTCSNEFSNFRFVVCARKLRSDESISDFDFSLTKLNYNAKGIDFKAVLSGETTTTATEISVSDTDETTDDSLTDSETGMSDSSVTEVPKSSEDESENTKKTKKTKKETSETTVPETNTETSNDSALSETSTESETETGSSSVTEATTPNYSQSTVTQMPNTTVGFGPLVNVQ